MPTPKFIVFTSNPASADESMLIEAFIKYGINPLVDSINHNNYHWFRKNFEKIPHKFFHVELDTVHPFTLDDLEEEMILTPDLAVYFNHDEQDIPWETIQLWLGYFMTPEGKIYHELTQDIQDFISQLDISPLQPPIISPPPTQKESNLQNTSYKFRLEHLTDLDICVYEVIKPHTELPYTSITRNFSTIGHKQFFGDLFICESWGVCSADIHFLRKVWPHLGMQEEYNPDEIYRERVEACFPTPNQVPSSEPEVYRRGMEEVIQRLCDQRLGIDCSHIGKRRRGNFPRN